jgi:UDP-glucuronate 4-epimerase
MKILITGAAGFIGFHLSLKLKKSKNEIIGYDNFNTYYDKHLKNLREKILNENNIEIIHADITNTNFLKKIILEKKIDVLVHLAAQAGVRHSLTNPKDYISSNLEGFASILEASKNSSIKKIIFASSSSVYGLNKKIPFDVEDKTDFPTNLYGATKKSNELLAYSHHHIYKIPIIGLRYFTVYGPFGRPDMAYFKFTKNILENKPIDIFNFGNMKRDFTYIDDIVDGTISAINLKNDNFEIFNLGNNNPVKLLEFIEIIEKNLNKKAIKNFLPLQKGEVLETYADISKSKKLLNFSPKVSIEEGMEKFIKWYKDYYNLSLNLK